MTSQEGEQPHWWEPKTMVMNNYREEGQHIILYRYIHKLCFISWLYWKRQSCAMWSGGANWIIVVSCSSFATERLLSTFQTKTQSYSIVKQHRLRILRIVIFSSRLRKGGRRNNNNNNNNLKKWEVTGGDWWWECKKRMVRNRPFKINIVEKRLRKSRGNNNARDRMIVIILKFAVS
jgi:hypothetical protein